MVPLKKWRIRVFVGWSLKRKMIVFGLEMGDFSSKNGSKYSLEIMRETMGWNGAPPIFKHIRFVRIFVGCHRLPRALSGLNQIMGFFDFGGA